MKTTRLMPLITGITCLCLFLPGCDSPASRSDYYTRGIGAYPGDPAEDFAPELVPAGGNYRNLAKLRSAYHSSSYDYNLTAQLATDGIISAGLPATINVSTQDGELKKNEREWFFDGKSDSRYRMSGDDVFLQLAMNNMDLPVDKIVLRGSVTFDPAKPRGYEVAAYGSTDGVQWQPLGEEKGPGRIGAEPQRRGGFGGFRMPPVDPDAPRPSFAFSFSPPEPSTIINQVFTLDQAVNYSYYKISLRMPSAKEWALSDWDFYNAGELLTITPSQYFNSAWESAGAGEEWVYVDLGATASFDKVNLHWLNKATDGAIQVSDDARAWNDVAPLPGGSEKTDAITLSGTAKGRYVRVLMRESENNTPYILSELEVWGKGGLAPRPVKAPAPDGNRLTLSGGSWTLQRSSEVAASGEEISQSGFSAEGWIPATVPGTVLTSYMRIGALPDPNYGDNQLQISESFFNSDFWYRNEFTLPAGFGGQSFFLNFDGINWKANVYVNGQKAGRIEGAFMRGRFDITSLLAGAGKTNVLAVEIIKNAHPGAIKEQTAISTDQNGGILGADNPTFHATVGWDWIPTIRGRNIGIWNDVFITGTGSVAIEDPFIRAELPLPDTTSARLFVEVTLRNQTAAPVSGTLKGLYGETAFEQDVTLEASETKVVSLDPSTTPSLLLRSPRLWWPKGYGEPYLYDVKLSFDIDGKASDEVAFRSGVRQMTFNEDNQTLSLFVNGRRFIGFGGNWGFGESNLNYRGREYDIAVAYHADMNFTMIRNWVGQIGDEEFYEACDRHGVMVWQDFWLANPVDGPNPYDNDLFIANAEDFVKRIRNHPSIGIYVGRNEGNPPQILDDAIRSIVPANHPGIHYISNSAMGVVSGGGPYRALPPRDYFLLYGNDKFHSERGMPNVMNYESLRQTLPPEVLWPQNSQYGLHDYTLASAQSAASFNAMIEKAFGPPRDAGQFAQWAQWINYNGYRAIFEGRSEYRRGMLLWMSHPAWPSMVWQTYDYYFDPTGAYFGCKKASEPIHIQWNPVYDYKKQDFIEVVNYHAWDRTGLTAKAQLINQDGSVQWEKEVVISAPEDSTVKAFNLEYPETLSDTYFIKLTLTENGEVISDNFYVRGKEDGNYQSLHQMPKVTLSTTSTVVRSGEEWLLTTTLKNDTPTPALMVRLQVTGDKTSARILPVFFSDNYIALMPGEEKTITMRLQNRDTRGETPGVEVTGFNI
ncbi:MAG: discoidin domain-containing protein [Tannerellaceae bacterium]|nr:discoidin domain-containing protein [Tannerellaceae bacterium]